jgi:hypothetical protein
MIVGLIAGVCWFAIYVAGHLIVVRLAHLAANPRLNQRLFLGGVVANAASVAVAGPLVASDVLTRGGWWLGTLWGELTYASLFCLYTPFYYVVVASLSVRTAVMLDGRRNHALPLRVLVDEFASRRLVGERLVTLTNNGFLAAREGRYFLTPKGRGMAVVFASIKRLWNLGPGG